MLLEPLPIAPLTEPTATDTPPPVSQETPPSAEPVQGVRKNAGPDIAGVFEEQMVTAEDRDEPTILQQVVPTGAGLVKKVLLKDNDRSGYAAWVEGPKVKQYYLTLKESLQTAFTSKVQDLVDEVQRLEGKPPYDFLSFYDPGLSKERIVFVRVRERLFEFHIPEGKDEIVFGLIDGLTH